MGRVRYLDLPWRAVTVGLVTAEGGPRTAASCSWPLAPVKGAEMLLTIWNGIAERHPAARLRILGEGAERGRLEAQVARLGIPRVDFLGRCSPLDGRRACNRVRLRSTSQSPRPGRGPLP